MSTTNQLVSNYRNIKEKKFIGSNNSDATIMKDLKKKQELRKAEKMALQNQKEGKTISNIIQSESVGKDLEFEKKINETQNDYKKNMKIFWKQRTNQPYKNILKGEDYTKNFEDVDDFVIHKVTEKDKEGIDEKLMDFKKDIKMHDRELGIVYSSDKQTKFKKDFEYNNRYKFRTVYKPSSQSRIKKNVMEYYKQEQKKLDKDKEKLDNIFDSLVEDGIFDDTELQAIANQN